MCNVCSSRASFCLPRAKIMTSPPTAGKRMPTIPEYAGAISRWCDLTGVVPEIPEGYPKATAEFEEFNRRLDQLAQQKRNEEDIGI